MIVRHRGYTERMKNQRCVAAQRQAEKALPLAIRKMMKIHKIWHVAACLAVSAGEPREVVNELLNRAHELRAQVDQMVRKYKAEEATNGYS